MGYDASGNLLFYIKDNVIYNSTSVNVGTLSSYTDASGNLYSSPWNEISIVPVPFSCRDYYIIYSVEGGGQWYEGIHLMYTRVTSTTTGGVTIVSNGHHLTSDSGFMSIAVGLLSSSNTRKLYSLGQSYSLLQYTISSTGISAGTMLNATVDINNNNNANNFGLELELSGDGQYLAWANHENTTNATTNVYLVNTQDSSPNGVHIIPITTAPAATSHGPTHYNGLEFSPTSDFTLYLSANNVNTSNPGGIYMLVINPTANTGALTQITTGHYQDTELELGRDGYIYGVDRISSGNYNTGLLGRFNPRLSVREIERSLKFI
jgi:hypothetical protein